MPARSSSRFATSGAAGFRRIGVTGSPRCTRYRSSAVRASNGKATLPSFPLAHWCRWPAAIVKGARSIRRARWPVSECRSSAAAECRFRDASRAIVRPARYRAPNGASFRGGTSRAVEGRRAVRRGNCVASRTNHCSGTAVWFAENYRRRFRDGAVEYRTSPDRCAGWGSGRRGRASLETCGIRRGDELD